MCLGRSQGLAPTLRLQPLAVSHMIIHCAMLAQQLVGISMPLPAFEDAMPEGKDTATGVAGWHYVSEEVNLLKASGACSSSTGDRVVCHNRSP